HCLPSGYLHGRCVLYPTQRLRCRVAVRCVRTRAPTSLTLWRGGLAMPRGRHTSIIIRLTADERRTLTAWQRSTAIPAGLARRGRIILLLADGVPLSHIATAVGISRRFVYKWVERFLKDGVAGLADKPRRDRGQTPRAEASRRPAL